MRALVYNLSTAGEREWAASQDAGNSMGAQRCCLQGLPRRRLACYSRHCEGGSLEGEAGWERPAEWVP